MANGMGFLTFSSPLKCLSSTIALVKWKWGLLRPTCDAKYQCWGSLSSTRWARRSKGRTDFLDCCFLLTPVMSSVPHYEHRRTSVPHPVLCARARRCSLKLESSHNTLASWKLMMPAPTTVLYATVSASGYFCIRRYIFFWSIAHNIRSITLQCAVQAILALA